MTSLTLVRRIAARPAIVFEALASPDGIRGWWGPDAGPVIIAESDVRVGGHYRARFRIFDGSEHEIRGEFLIVDPPRRLSMSWRWQGNEDDTGSSELELTLRPIPEGTELTLTHTKLRDEQIRESHTEGWNGALDKLETMFVGGERTR